MSDWIRSSKGSAYHKPANGDTAGNVTAVCKRIVPARHIAGEATVYMMDEAGYAFMCKDCKANLTSS